MNSRVCKALDRVDSQAGELTKSDMFKQNRQESLDESHSVMTPDHVRSVWLDTRGLGAGQSTPTSTSTSS